MALSPCEPTRRPASSGMPRPSSAISMVSRVPSSVLSTPASMVRRVPLACFTMFDMASCAVRNTAMPASGGMSMSTSRPFMCSVSCACSLVCVPSQRSAVNRPMLSSRVGRRSSMTRALEFQPLRHGLLDACPARLQVRILARAPAACGSARCPCAWLPAGRRAHRAARAPAHVSPSRRRGSCGGSGRAARWCARRSARRGSAAKPLRRRMSRVASKPSTSRMAMVNTALQVLMITLACRSFPHSFTPAAICWRSCMRRPSMA